MCSIAESRPPVPPVECRADDITSLHQVEVARAHFERIVALRDGRIAFDAPAAEVTDDMLRALYADHEDELSERLEGAAPFVDQSPGLATAVSPGTCR